MNLKEAVILLDRIGLMDVVLPFILVFVLLFAILQKTKILGKDKRRLNLTVAVVVSLMAISTHFFPSPVDVVKFINDSSITIVFGVIGLFCALAIMGLLGQDISYSKEDFGIWAAGLTVLILINILLDVTLIIPLLSICLVVGFWAGSKSKNAFFSIMMFYVLCIIAYAFIKPLTTPGAMSWYDYPANINMSIFVLLVSLSIGWIYKAGKKRDEEKEKKTEKKE